jgi:hypothetical protein
MTNMSLTEKVAMWKEEADETLVKHVDQLIAAKHAGWRWDPEVDGVVGLVVLGTNRALVVIYSDDECDWELDSRLEEALCSGMLDGMVEDEVTE